MPRSREKPTLIEAMWRSNKSFPGHPSARNVENAPSTDPQPKNLGSKTLGGSQGDGDRRIRFSLSPLSLSMAILTIGLMMLASYHMGRQSGMRQLARESSDGFPAADPQILAARQAAPQPHVLEDLEQVHEDIESSNLKQRRDEQPDEILWLDGLNYIWIVAFGNLAEAEDAQNFLAVNGIESTPVELTQAKKWMLVSNQGFVLPQESNACESFMSKIRSLGKTYSQSGARYHFDDCYPRKRSHDHW